MSYLLTTTSLKNEVQYFSWLGIPKILMNVMSCHGFSKPTTSKVIITYHKALVLYHLTREFRIVKKVKCVFYN